MTVEELEGLFGKGSVIFSIETTRYVITEKQKPSREVLENPESDSQIVPPKDLK